MWCTARAMSTAMESTSLRASNRWPGLVEFAFPWMWNGRSIMRLRPDLKKLAPVELKNVEVPMDLFRIVLPWERDALTGKSQKPNLGSDDQFPSSGLGPLCFC